MGKRPIPKRWGTARVLVVLTSLISLFTFAFLPLSLVLSSALHDSARSLLAELGDHDARRAWMNSMLLAAGVTLVAVPSGAFFAWLLARTDLYSSHRARTRALALLSVPLAIPPYFLAMSWSILGNGKSGLLNRFAEGPWIDLYGPSGIALVLSSSSYPFSMLSVIASLKRADPSLEEAARVSGASPRRVLSDITLPLIAPTIVASAGLVFVFTLAAFGVPYLLGSSADPPFIVLTTRIFRHTALGGSEVLARASALALSLLVTALSVQTIAGWIANRRSVIQVTGKSARHALIPLGRARRPLSILVALFASIIVLLPLCVILSTSLERTFSDPTVLTTEHWRGVLGRHETGRALLHSVILALASGAIVAAFGFTLARMAKTGGRAFEMLASLASAPYAVPGTVIALGLILAFAHEVRVIFFESLTVAFFLPGTLAMLLVAYTVKNLAFGVRGARAALDQLHPSLEEAARISGAGAWRGLGDVVIPLAFPALAASFAVVALQNLSELTMSVLLFGAGTETAGTLLFELQSYDSPPAAAVVATLIVIIAVGGDLALRRYRGRYARDEGESPS